MLAKLEPNWILIKSIDCGDEAAEWLNTCLRKSSLRLIRAEYEITDKSILNRNDVLILNEEDVENWDFTALTHCVVVTQESLEMFYYSDPLAVKLRPHILISSPGYPAFAEQTWEWIKIGNVIMRNFMPVLSHPRHQRKEHYRSGLPSFMGVFYGLYTTGYLNVNDDVFIHMTKPENTGLRKCFTK